MEKEKNTNQISFLTKDDTHEGLLTFIKKKAFDEDEIRTHAGRAQWISSPSP